MRFYAPMLAYLGYQVDESAGETVRVNIHVATGSAFNIWQADPVLTEERFEVYAPGLHHIAFNVAEKSAVDELGALIPTWGGSVTDGPAVFPYTNHGEYYAVYCRDLDNLKLEFVWMSELEKQYRQAGLIDRRLWDHEEG